MALVVTNTLSGKKEPFQPQEEGKVKIYVCGLTPYDRLHIGHVRTYAAWDIIRRYLEHKGFDVTHVQNITDVEDKIIQRAHENGEHPIALAERMHALAEAEFEQLGFLRPHAYPKVSESMDGIIEMTQTLIRKGFAYAGEDEHGTSVYFDVSADPDYGKLSRTKPEDLKEGVRKTVAGGKRNAADFALWKAAKPGEVTWDSPWGKGRPGWHIECSVMSTVLLGPSYDMHGGGMDLVFPHHENELAQAESATGVDPYAKYWVHTGFLTVEGEKMSKSLGNFVTVESALQEWRPEVLRIWLAGTHYRSPIDFSESGLAQAAKSLERIENLLANVEHAMKDARGGEATEPDRAFAAGVGEREQAFTDAMDNDFNTPVALAVVQDFITDVNKYLGAHTAHGPTLQAARGTFRSLTSVLGILPFSQKPTTSADQAVVADLVDLLLDLRHEARARKDFATGDRIRDRLTDLDFVIEDTPEGARWRRKARR